MKIKKVASVLIMMIAILLIAGIFSASYAATSMSLTISRFHASGFGYQIGQGGRGNRSRAFNYEICCVTESFQSRLSFIPFEMYFFRPER